MFKSEGLGISGECYVIICVDLVEEYSLLGQLKL